MFRKPKNAIERNQDAADFLIIGAGVSGVALFRQLVEKAIANNKTDISICLMNEEKSLGTGLPYLKDQSHILRVNDYADNLSLHPTNLLEFLEWVYANPAIAKRFNFVVEKTSAGFVFNEDYPPRALYGHYFQAVLNSTIEKAIVHGIQIQIVKNNATSVQKTMVNGSRIWHVFSGSGKKVTAKNLILATGLLPSNKFDKFNSNAHFHPALSDTVSKIEPNSTVAILGSRLSAYDSVRLLLLNNHHLGNIILISESGLISQVRNYRIKPAPTIQMKYLTPENITKYKDHLTLEYIVDLFNKEISEHLGKAFSLNVYLQEEAKEDMGKRLEKGVQYNKDGKILNIFLPVLHNMVFSVFPLLCKYLPEAQLISFMSKYYGSFSRHAFTIPLMTAELMNDSYIQGQLSFQSGFENIESVGDSFKIQTKNGVITADHIIDATGGGKSIMADPLLKQMCESGYICQHFFSGIQVDLETAKAFKEGRIPQDNLYAIGVVTFGSNLSVYSIVGCIQQTQVLADQLVTKMENDKDQQMVCRR